MMWGNEATADARVAVLRNERRVRCGVFMGGRTAIFATGRPPKASRGVVLTVESPAVQPYHAFPVKRLAYAGAPSARKRLVDPFTKMMDQKQMRFLRRSATVAWHDEVAARETFGLATATAE